MARTNAAVRVPAALVASIVATFALALSTVARAATITVDSLADTGTIGICVLRDAITAANTKTARHGCTAGTGNDTIQFSVTGTITLGSTLPQITDSKLMIKGSASPSITIDGGDRVEVMDVASGATLSLNNLKIANGYSRVYTSAGGILNNGKLNITNSTFSTNSDSGDGYVAGAIVNFGTLTVANTIFSSNSLTSGDYGYNFGGGILNLGTLTVTNSTFSGNRGADGGGIYNFDAMASVSNSTFSDNSASAGDDGGGIYNQGGTVTISNSVFSGNSAGREGGGIQSNGGTLTVTNSSFSGNSVDADGGGISNDNGGILTVTNSAFSGNSASRGGGIVNNGTVAVINSTLSANTTGILGGAIFNYATMTITNSTLSANTTEGNGGAIFNDWELTVTDSTFAGNSAPIGGGIDNDNGGTLTVTNSTFLGNIAGDGGGIHNTEGTLASFKNTIAAANRASNGKGNCSGTVTDAGYNISDDGSCGFAKTGSANNGDGVNPLLSPAGLANNGGPTQTIALLPGSPAIDAIPLGYCKDQASPPNPIITDQRGFPRPDAGESACDIGAFEVQDAAFVPFTSFNGSVRIDPDAGVFALLGGFTVRNGLTINPITQPVAFSIGSYAIRLPAGSFTRFSNGYFYKKTVNGISLRINIQFTRVPIAYTFQAYRSGGTIDSSTSPLPVTLTIGNNVGTKQMKATYY